MGWMMEIQDLAGAIFLLFATMLRLALVPTQPPIQWVPGALSPGVKHLWTTHLCLVPRLLHGAVPMLPQYSFMAWCLIKQDVHLHGVVLYLA
jgi:hypothetical protein